MKKKFKSSLLNLFKSQFINQSNDLSEINFKYNFGRRRFLTNTSIAALGIGITPTVLNSCNLKNNNQKTTVAILGAGIAGLQAGYILSKSNIDFKIFEATSRTGGRMFTAKDVIAQGITTELGGEFIDSNHEDMLNLVKEFNLELLDFETDIKSNKLIKDTYYFNNRHYSEVELISEFSKYVKLIEVDIKLIDEEDESAIEKYDNISIEEYLKEKGITGWLFEMLVAAFTGEYGLDASEQSSLNMLYMLETDTSDGFKVYGDSDERYKIKGGNELLTSKLSEKISSMILKDHQCISIDEKEGIYNLNFKNGDSYSAQYLIVAIPFTALRKIDLKVKLPESKTKAIQELGYGTNSKIIFGFTERVWRKSSYSGYLFTKNIHNGWDSSELQNNNESNGGYTVFVGGKAGKDLSEKQADIYLTDLNSVFPGSKDKLNGKKVIFNWSKSSLVEGSYSAYKIGQWSTIAGNEQLPVGNMFFAGEHCSEDFQGYMNGGAETGRVAAENIITAIKKV